MDYLAPTYYFDYESDEIQTMIAPFKSNDMSQKEKAKALYLLIRDSYRYNPYDVSFSADRYRSSLISKRQTGHCLDKSILYISGLRALGIPARIHLAKVKNHIGVERLMEKLGTNELTPHGMVNLFIDEKWLKASPAFNKELCLKCNVAPLDFNGEEDSVFQEYSIDGNLFMEYLEDYGHFPDVPLDFIEQNIKSHYPHLFLEEEI
ncbi:transglutaminase-like domain-containing protein [Spongiimicrobium salis]|uniref:transglutaminase-like domain-containing protein n=1 Tax=Spongiimicrobium salis TaxID=1667022 RepID=UPI00374CD7A7